MEQIKKEATQEELESFSDYVKESLHKAASFKEKKDTNPSEITAIEYYQESVRIIELDQGIIQFATNYKLELKSSLFERIMEQAKELSSKTVKLRSRNFAINS